MNCDICQRAHDAQRLPFLCAVDARNQCYEGRVRNLQVMLESDNLQKQIHDLMAETQSASSPRTKLHVDASVSEQRAAEDKTSQVMAQTERLRTEIAGARREIESRKEAIARRKSDLASASGGIVDRREAHQKSVEASIQRGSAMVERCSDQLASTRSFLCMEAAKLYGLRRNKKGARYEYRIGGIEVIDLSSMNSLTPEVISTSLAHIAHILVLATHYLAIRLPAEITLPHRDYPRPTIFNLSSSYQHGRDVPFPGTAAIPNFALDPVRDREAQYVPRPRPLFVDKPLPALAKDDPAGYKMFLEGATLLAYDVAWACCSQGVPIGDRTSFEDVCQLGRNLYALLIGQHLHGTQTSRAYSTSPQTSNGTPTGGNSNGASSNVDQVVDNSKGATTVMGRFSHGTAHNFLGSAQGSDFVKQFKLPSPKNLSDRLRSQLASDAAVPQEAWEVLGKDAWEVEEEEDGVIVGNREGNGQGNIQGLGKSNAKKGQGDDSYSHRPSGWTKVKAR